MSDEAIRNQYQQLGIANYYQKHGASYRNPHEPIIRDVLKQALVLWQPDTSRVLDLACGSGEVTLVLRELGINNIEGVDPYTIAAYQERTEQAALPLSFVDIANGALSSKHYSLIVCSFALHLAEYSRLPMLCYQLASLAPSLLIVTPHKRPEIKPVWGWHLQGKFIHERVRARYYLSMINLQGSEWGG